MQTFRLRINVFEIWDISIEAEDESEAIGIVQMMPPEDIRVSGELLATESAIGLQFLKTFPT